jgi:hypothetical protein
MDGKCKIITMDGEMNNRTMGGEISLRTTNGRIRYLPIMEGEIRRLTMDGIIRWLIITMDGEIRYLIMDGETRCLQTTTTITGGEISDNVYNFDKIIIILIKKYEFRQITSWTKKAVIESSQSIQNN